MKSEGEIPEYHNVVGEEYLLRLKHKLSEETVELFKIDTDIVEEAGDVLEVLDAYLRFHGFDHNQALESKLIKKEKNDDLTNELY